MRLWATKQQRHQKGSSSKFSIKSTSIKTKSNEDLDNGIDHVSGERISGSIDQKDDNIQVIDHETDNDQSKHDPAEPINVTEFNNVPKTAVDKRTRTDLLAS